MRNKKRWGAAFALIFFLFCVSCQDSAKAATMHLVKAEGTVDVSDEEGAAVEMRENLGLYSGYRMETETESYAWINLDQVKLTKMDAESRAEIHKNGKQLEIFLHAGSLFFHVTEPLEEDETLEIHTSSMLVGIRGTCGWVECIDSSHARVYILEGTIECSAADESGETVSVSGGEMAELINGEITVSPFDESQIPLFVREELLEDEALQRETDDAPGPETDDTSRRETDDASGRETDDASGPETQTPPEEDSFFREGIRIPGREEWNGDYNTPMATLSMFEEDTAMPSGETDWEDMMNRPVSYRQVEAGIWCYGETVAQLSEAGYGEMAAFNQEGYEWRILTWGGVGSPDDLEGYRGLIVADYAYSSTSVQDSDSWDEQESAYYYAEDSEAGVIRECYREYSFTVACDGAEDTGGKLLVVSAVDLSGGERHTCAVLVRVPAGYEGTIRLEVYGNKAEEGVLTKNQEEAAVFLY